MKLGLLIASLSRQAGGLFWAIRSLAGSIRCADCDVQVFAGEDDYSAQDMVTWGKIPLSVFPKRGPAAFGYQVGLSAALVDANLDLVHVHGLWMYSSVAAKVWGRQGKPYLISPHGMLDPWAVCNSSWKKRLAGLVYENAHLRGAACIHALCDSEYESVRAYGLSNPVAVIPNGVVLPDLRTALPAPEWSTLLPADSKLLFFLGRLHPKKGLVNLLHAWAGIKREKMTTADPWHLVIAGWDQGGHKAELEKLITDLSIKATVHLIGPQFDTAKDSNLKYADAFILPSFSEGLPMAVLEAWSYGLPVLMTQHCNIPVGFESDAAIKILPEVISIRQGLKDLFLLGDSERVAMGQRGRRLVEERFTWEKIANEMMEVYHWILKGGIPPGCVRLG